MVLNFIMIYRLALLTFYQPTTNFAPLNHLTFSNCTHKYIKLFMMLTDTLLYYIPICENIIIECYNDIHCFVFMRSSSTILYVSVDCRIVIDALIATPSSDTLQIRIYNLIPLQNTLPWTQHHEHISGSSKSRPTLTKYHKKINVSYKSEFNPLACHNSSVERSLDLLGAQRSVTTRGGGATARHSNTGPRPARSVTALYRVALIWFPPPGQSTDCLVRGRTYASLS